MKRKSHCRVDGATMIMNHRTSQNHNLRGSLTSNIKALVGSKLNVFLVCVLADKLSKSFTKKQPY